MTDRDVYSMSAPPEVWWDAHFHQAADQVLEFLAGDGIRLEAKRVADIGCGDDGFIDLGLAVRGKPKVLVGFDLTPPDIDTLAREAAAHGIATLPPDLRFARSEELSIPADDASFDIVVSWSAFEHISDPVAILREIRRVLTPDGVVFIQVWPFFATAHGPHLQDWFPDGFAHYLHAEEDMFRIVREHPNQGQAARMLEEYRRLNRISADELHAALRVAGFRTAKLALLSETVHIPESAADVPFSRIALSGVKLLAVPDPQVGPA
ncbi:MAG TPA: class I SAM-dependent methyltransferase [Jatrophihabitantaceae bacterium]|nr:class I SAM-dependent methyltransferase [Jatrophihabitantaceae bacterium]